MRRRLMAAILVLVAGTLVLAGVGSLLLVRRASTNTAEQQLYTQAKALADYPRPQVFLHSLRVVKYVGQYDALTIVGLSGAGTFTGALPGSLRGLDLQAPQLHDDAAVAGATGNHVYVLIPLQLTTVQKSHLKHPIPYQDTAVLVATRAVHPSVGGFGYFLLVGLACLTVAGVVAYLLARRFSLPLVVAAQATERIAGGDLGSPIPVAAHDMPEFASLANAINAMGARLQRARDQQRHFLLSVSHELRTPLTSIRGYSDAVAEGATDDVGAAIEVIGIEARRLERLVQDLLDLARLDAERFGFQLSSVDAAAIAARTVEHLRPEAERAGVDLTFSTPVPGPQWVVTDADRLQQLLSNLIENAWHFARRRVVVGVRMEHGTVVLWVDDDGPGIAPADLSHVFEPHFTSDRAGSRRPGTGLGLAIVAELAAAMGGGVRAESPSTASGGTRMVAWLPVAPVTSAGADLQDR